MTIFNSEEFVIIIPSYWCDGKLIFVGEKKMNAPKDRLQVMFWKSIFLEKDSRSFFKNLYILQCEILLKIEDIFKDYPDRNKWNHVQ